MHLQTTPNIDTNSNIYWLKKTCHNYDVYIMSHGSVSTVSLSQVPIHTITNQTANTPMYEYTWMLEWCIQTKTVKLNK